MLRLLTLGSLSVHGADGPLSGSAAQPRRLAVLVLVARGGSRGTARAKVLNLLWPDADDEQGRRAIAQALYTLRRDLGNDDAIVGTQELRLNPDVVACDLADFEAALGRGDGAAAVALYTGAFLDGFRLSSAPEFERWVDDERSAIEHRYHDAVERLARDAEARGALDEAARWWRRRAAGEPLNARVAVALMRALAGAGDVTGALRHARVFEALMAEELEMPADGEVLAYAESLRRVAPPLPAAVSSPASISASTPLSARSIAVLPFAVLGRANTGGDDRLWADGLSEEILTALLDLPVLRVVARGASFSLGPSPSLAPLRELSVSHAIEGSVRRTDDGLRVSVRLIETREGRAVWWDRFDCAAHDSAATQERIASRVADVLSRPMSA